MTRAAALLATLALALAACANGDEPEGSVTLHVDGHDVTMSGPETVRALRVTLEWDAALAVTAIAAGKDAARMNIFRTDLAAGTTTAQVLLTDTRKIKLPARGTMIHLDASGDGAVRVVGAEAVLDGATKTRVFVK